MPGVINRLEVFAAGTWKPATGGTVTVTESDLDEIVQSFQELQGSNLVKPHLKLGHTDAQKWFGQRNGVPTLGWVTNLYREGKKLLADIANVPEALLEMIKQGRYHNVSSEIYLPGQIEHNGKKFGHVLSAIAILGTEMPAVKDLAGLAAALYATQFTAKVEAQPTSYTQEIVKSMFTQEQVDSLIAAAVGKAVAETKAEFSSQVDNLKSEVTVLTQRAEGAENKLAEQAREFAQKEAVAIVDAAIKDGKLLPKQKDAALAFMSVQGPIKFGGEEKSATQVFGAFLDLMGKQVDTSERGSGKEGSRNSTQFATAAQEVDSLVQVAIAANPKVLYADALKQVLGSNPDLADRYAKGV